MVINYTDLYRLQHHQPSTLRDTVSQNPKTYIFRLPRHTDFGVSVDWCNAKSSTTASQNPPYHISYAAPELVNKPQRPRNNKSDVFSLGCIYVDIVALATNASQLLQRTGGMCGGYRFYNNLRALFVVEDYAGRVGAS